MTRTKKNPKKPPTHLYNKQLVFKWVKCLYNQLTKQTVLKISACKYAQHYENYCEMPLHPYQKNLKLKNKY